MVKKDSYISFLEEAVTKHPNAPCDGIVSWDGKGKLPTTTDSGIDDLVAKITKGDSPTDKGIQEDTKKESGKSPLSILENELNEAEEEASEEEKNTEPTEKETPEGEDIEESIKFTDQESDILTRLISEMNNLDDVGEQDELMDEEEVGEPEEDYELDDLDVD